MGMLKDYYSLFQTGSYFGHFLPSVMIKSLLTSGNMVSKSKRQEITLHPDVIGGKTKDEHTQNISHNHSLYRKTVCVHYTTVIG